METEEEVTKNIRVAWDDLQLGDKVHLKGSDNVYQYVRDSLTAYDDMPCDGKRSNKIIVTAPGIYDAIKVPKSMFAYATRPAPRKPKLHEPTLCGEYWVHTDGGWRKLVLLGTFVKGKCWTMNGYSAFSWDDIVTHIRPTGILDAEEYYTRKIKGEL